MVIFKNRIISFLIFVSAIILIDLIFFEIAMPAGSKQISLDENPKPGMAKTIHSKIEVSKRK